jgi:SPP1 family predicted phage head-tail adaptor
MINPGKMRDQITLERHTETVMPSGSIASEWNSYSTIRAELVQQELADYLSGMGEAQTGTVAFRVWYLAGITTADRITHNGETYAITAVVEIANGRGLEIRAVTQ